MMLCVGAAAALHFTRYLPSQWSHVLGFASSITPADVVNDTNKERAKLGLEPLTLSPVLSQAALSKGQDMFTEQYWAHTSPQGKEPWAFMRAAGYNYQVAGENLARDFDDTTDMVAAWMASPTHRANIVNSRYTEIGIAVIDGNLQGTDTTLVVQMFGKPRVSAANPEVSERAPQLEEMPEISTEPVELAPSPVSSPLLRTPAILARALVPTGDISAPVLFSPLSLAKSFFLAVIMLLVCVLVYDSFVIGHHSALRLVGKNLGHIIFLLVIAFLLILFKGGIIT